MWRGNSCMKHSTAHTWRVDQLQCPVDLSDHLVLQRLSIVDYPVMPLQRYLLMNQSNTSVGWPNQLQDPPVKQCLRNEKKKKLINMPLNRIEIMPNEYALATFTDENLLIATIVFRTVNLHCTDVWPINSSCWTILINTNCHLEKSEEEWKKKHVNKEKLIRKTLIDSILRLMWQ